MSAKFNPGDKVLVNGSQLATIQAYNTKTGQLIFVQEINGGTNTVYGPISAYRLEHLIDPAITLAVDPEPTPESHRPVPGLNDSDSEDEYQAAGEL